MYVDQNKFLKTFVILIIYATTLGCLFADYPFRIVALSKNKAVIVDGVANQRILNVGDSTKSGLKLVSANSSIAIFKDPNGKLVSLGINDEIIVLPKKANTLDDDSEIIELTKNNEYLTTVNINGKDVSAVIDTGANFVALNSNMANQLGIPYTNNSTKINASTASDRSVDGYQITLNKIKLGKIELSNIEAIVLEGNNPEVVLIGMSFLKNLELKHLGNRLEIKKTKLTPVNATKN